VSEYNGRKGEKRHPLLPLAPLHFVFALLWGLGPRLGDHINDPLFFNVWRQTGVFTGRCLALRI